jgi:hypothetical protein
MVERVDWDAMFSRVTLQDDVEDSTPTLKQCPFCGAIPRVEREENDDWLVWCRCGCVLAPFGASDEAIKSWNKREGEVNGEPI